MLLYPSAANLSYCNVTCYNNIFAFGIFRFGHSEYMTSAISKYANIYRSIYNIYQSIYNIYMQELRADPRPQGGAEAAV